VGPPHQDLPTVLAGLEAAWTFFQGVVPRLVVDNLKPVVTRADRYAPQIDRVILEYAQHRGFLVDPTVPRPRVDARASRLVRITRRMPSRLRRPQGCNGYPSTPKAHPEILELRPFVPARNYPAKPYPVTALIVPF
jgi:hypothetical protein